MAWKGRNLFDFFPGVSEELILGGFDRLSGKSQKKLKFVFGDDLKNRDKWLTLSRAERNRINSMVYITLKKKIEQIKNGEENKKRNRKNNSNENFDRDKEILFIKKAKLSYYDEISDDLKKLYLNYYFEVFPQLKTKYDNLSIDEREKMLNEEIENSKKWRDIFFNNNLGLVGYVASKYSSYGYQDCFQEGVFGLNEALKRYDISRKTKFSTYAVFWIKRYIARYISYSHSTVRIPLNTANLFRRLNIINYEYYVKNKCYPSDEKLSEIAGCSLNMVKEYKGYNYYTENPIYLDDVVSDEGKATYSNFVEDKDSQFQDDVDNEIIAANVMKIMDNIFDSRTKYILIRRYGLDGSGVHSLREVASEIGLSPQGILRIEKKALSRIRNYNIEKHFDNEKVEKQSKNNFDSISFKILKLHYINDMSLDDIADEFNIEVNCVIEIIKNGLSKIREDYDYKNGKVVKKRL